MATAQYMNDGDVQHGKKYSLTLQLMARMIFTCIFILCLGLSVINAVPEELIYLTLTGLVMDLEVEGSKLALTFDLANFQIDNQCREAVAPVVLYPLMGSGKNILLLL